MPHLVVPVSERILYEDNHLIIINKMPSELVQGDNTGDEPLSESLKKYLKEKYNKPGNVFVGVIHRLDRPVSGAVVFAKTGKALSRMNELVKSRGLQKTYWALVKENPPSTEDKLIHYLVRNQAKNKSFAYRNQVKNSKEAILTYRLLGKSDNYNLLEVSLITGRHHQIRVQLAAIGCPIKGDLKYGYRRSNPDASISLHAREIEFIHPVKKENIKIIAPTPNANIWNFFND